MKKIPTLFKREFLDHHVINISPEMSSPDLAWVLAGEGVATEKIDGACCAIIDANVLKDYRRYFDLIEFAIFCRDFETENFDAFAEGLA